MTRMNMIPAEFQGVKLDIIDHQGKRWLTAEQIGLALGYSDVNARDGIRRLYERHEDEFASTDTTTVKLTAVDGKLRDMRIFADTGCILLGMFASTQRAKAFRLWAKETLAGLPPAPVVARPVPRATVRVTREVERQVLELFVDGYSQTEMAEALRISRSSVNLLIHGKYRFAPGLGASQCPPDLISEVTARHMQIEADRLARVQDSIAQKYLASGCNQDLVDSLEYVGQCALDGTLVQLADDGKLSLRNN
ncbi:MAG TPA: hypothetical protein PLR02_07265 [Rhodocyclaceae bacterium]|nr:hypothetical protein [Rhodocyclaceae bacterium]